MTAYRANVVTTCPACHLPMSLTTTEVTVAPNGKATVGHGAVDRAVSMHLRYGCSAVVACWAEEDET